MPDIDAPEEIPKNLIANWSGLIADIPKGWLLCDGTLGTPDLRSKFVKCVPDAVTDPGTLGGEDTHALITAELPSHNHGITDPTHSHSLSMFGFGGANPNNRAGDPNNNQPQVGFSDETTGLTLTNSGSGTAHENRPAFFELLYIMRGL